MTDTSNRRRPLKLLAGLVLALTISLVLTQWGAVGKPAVVEAAPRAQTVPVITFASPTASIDEPDSGQTVDVNLSVRINTAPTNTQAQVRYSTANGSALSGQDYEPATGTLTFPVGSTNEQIIKIKIFGNDEYRGDRTFVVFLTNPVNAETGTPASVTVTIREDDLPPATNTPTPTPGGAVFIDEYEPNNEFGTAYETAANAAKLTRITLWPVGDEDYFKFYARKGGYYEVSTLDITAGLDTLLKVYDPSGGKIGENDQVSPTNPNSLVAFTAKQDGFYFARVLNQNPTDPTARTYSLEIKQLDPPTPTPTPTLIGAPDVCEPNNSRESACLIGVGEVKTQMNFVPPSGSGVDNDFYVLPVKPGVLYTCETRNLSAANDTNIIFLNNDGGDFNPQLGNDDRALGDPSSLLSVYSTYQGNLYILVGPVNPPRYEDSPQFTYDITCTSVAATPTPLPTATFPAAPISPPGGGGFVPTQVVPTALPTPTPIDISSLLPTQASPPLVDFVPLPTSTPAGGAGQATTVSLTVFYDSNYNYTPELTEGIMDVEVGLFDVASGSLLAFGYTNEAGIVRFDSILTSGAVRVVVPFLNYSQVITGASANILLRVDPRPLPSGIP